MNEIICCDVLEGLAKIPDETCDICLIDPPYNIGKDFGPSKDRLTIKEYKKWSDKWISESERILKDSGTLYIYGVPEILCHIAVDLPYPLEHRWLVWYYKNKATVAGNFWGRAHESILCCWKSNKRIFNLDDVRIPYSDAFLKNAAGKKRKATPGRFSRGETSTTYTEHPLGGRPRDVLEVAALAGGAGLVERWFLCKTCDECYSNKEYNKHKDHVVIKHPTQKPMKLTRKLLAAAKPEKDGFVVLPFAGSGSECAICCDLGLNFIAFDNNEDYVKLASKFLTNRLNNG